MKVVVYIILGIHEFPLKIFDNFFDAINFKDFLKSENPDFNFYHRQDNSIKESELLTVEKAKELLGNG